MQTTILCVLRLPNSECVGEMVTFCFCSSIMHEVGIPSKNVAAHVWLGIPLLLYRCQWKHVHKSSYFRSFFPIYLFTNNKITFPPRFALYIGWYYINFVDCPRRRNSFCPTTVDAPHTRTFPDSSKNENHTLKKDGVNGDETRYFCRKLNPNAIGFN